MVQIRRKHIFVIGIIFIIASTVTIYYIGLYPYNSWYPDNTFKQGSDPVLSDYEDDLMEYNIETKKLTPKTGLDSNIDIRHIYHLDSGCGGLFYLIFWYKVIPWNDSRYGFAVYIYLNPKTPSLPTTTYEFTLLCKNGNITFYDNSIPREYWNGTGWNTTPYNLTYGASGDPNIDFYGLSTSNALYFKNIPYACCLRYNYPIYTFSIAINGLIKGVFHFQDNDSSLIYYDWIPGIDLVVYKNDLPIFNILIVILLMVIPLMILVDFIGRKVIEGYSTPSKNGIKRPYSRRKKKKKQ